MLLLTASVESGVYRIVDTANQTMYIGSAVKVRTRLRSHVDMLRRGGHCNSHLQRAWDRDGESAFVFEQITSCDKEALIATEQWWVDYYRATGTRLFNLRPVVESQLGFKHSQESRTRMSQSKLAMTDETKAKIADATRRYAVEHPGEMAARRVGKPHSEATRAMLRGRVPWNKGQAMPEATRQKISLNRTGKGVGRPAWNRGKSPTEETLTRRSAGIKAAHAAKTPAEYAEIARKGWETRRRNQQFSS